MGDPPDIELRNAALEHVRELQRRYDDLVPVRALPEGFQFRGRRVSFGSFYSGIFRPKELEGPAALCLVTAPPKTGRPAPYDDEFDEATDRVAYRFRHEDADPAARLQAAADNRALVAAHELAVPLIYVRGIASGQYAVIVPTFVIAVDERSELSPLHLALRARLRDDSSRHHPAAPSGKINDNNNRREVGPHQASTVGPHQASTVGPLRVSTPSVGCRERSRITSRAARIRSTALTRSAGSNSSKTCA